MKKVFLLEGCWFYRKDAISKIKESLGDCDLYHVDEKYSYEYVKQIIMELSCFDNRKLIIILVSRHCPKIIIIRLSINFYIICTIAIYKRR